MTALAGSRRDDGRGQDAGVEGTAIKLHRQIVVAPGTGLFPGAPDGGASSPLMATTLAELLGIARSGFGADGVHHPINSTCIC
jgi:hypothetical protein